MIDHILGNVLRTEPAEIDSVGLDWVCEAFLTKLNEQAQQTQMSQDPTQTQVPDSSAASSGSDLGHFPPRAQSSQSEVGHLELPQPWAETKGSEYEAPVTDPG